MDSRQMDLPTTGRLHPTITLERCHAWFLAVAFTSALAASGCRSTSDLTLLENENRRLEDKVYTLQDELEHHCDLVDDLEKKNRSLVEDLAGARKASGSPATDVPDIDIDVDLPIAPPPDPLDVPPAPDFPRLENPGSPPVARRRPPSSSVTRITLDRLYTGRPSADGRVIVVVEPRNLAGEIIPAAGEISLTVVDPAVEGEERRLAHWSFSSDEASTRFRVTRLGERLYFDLDWPGEPIDRRDLKLEVRYTTSDGRKLVAQAPIQVRSAGATVPTMVADRPAGPSEEAPAPAERSAPARRPSWAPFR